MYLIKFSLSLNKISTLTIGAFLQGRLYTKSSVLGRVLIGSEGPEVGQQHWKEMCSRGQVETARWHTLQSDTP